jgi:hypothetical protein
MQTRGKGLQGPAVATLAALAQKLADAGGLVSACSVHRLAIGLSRSAPAFVGSGQPWRCTRPRGKRRSQRDRLPLSGDSLQLNDSARQFSAADAMCDRPPGLSPADARGAGAANQVSPFPETLDGNVDFERLSGAANPGCSRLSGGLLRARMRWFPSQETLPTGIVCRSCERDMVIVIQVRSANVPDSFESWAGP